MLFSPGSLLPSHIRGLQHIDVYMGAISPQSWQLNQNHTEMPDYLTTTPPVDSRGAGTVNTALNSYRILGPTHVSEATLEKVVAPV